MHRIPQNLIKWPRPLKRAVLLLADVVLLMAALWASFSLRLGVWYSPFAASGGTKSSQYFSSMFPSLPPMPDVAWLFIAAPVLGIPVFIRFGLYRAIVRFLGYRAIWSVIQAVSLYALLWASLALISGVQGIPRSVVLINALVALVFVGGARMAMRYVLLLGESAQKKAEGKPKTRVMIFGAGNAGRQLARSMVESGRFHLCGFADDERQLQGRDLMGVPVVVPENLADFIERCKVQELLLAIPSATRETRRVILERLQVLPVRVRTLPDLADVIGGRVSVGDLQELDIDDLLGRLPAQPDVELLQSQITRKVVMVTGAGGSIGSEMCRQVLRYRPKVLLLVELNEFALYAIHREMLEFARRLEEEAVQGDAGVGIRLVPRILPILGTVQSPKRMSELMNTWQPDVVYHAAAYKHVPMVEHNPAEGLKNNVFGTLIAARAAIEAKVPNFVLISTDKAVRPTNIMGASKRLAEMTLQALAAETAPEWECLNEPKTQLENQTHFSMVRFGNVLGSSGSVVPLFREQIAAGGPITLTDAEVTRYFMSIPEAAQLVMQAGALASSPVIARSEATKQSTAEGGPKADGSPRAFGPRDDASGRPAEVFVLDMGEPVKILDLAKRMVELSGLRVKDEACPQGDIEIEITGLRPGEKRYEELLIGDNPLSTAHPRILKAREEFLPWVELQPQLRALRIATDNNDIEAIRGLLEKLVVGYQPDPNVVDWVYLEQTATRGGGR
jgi:FlaA1/EpsC-like NDP-sugar epimerase